MTPVPEVVPINIHSNGRGHLKLAQSIRSLRLRNGLSQRQLALRMSVRELTYRRSKTRRPRRLCRLWNGWLGPLRSAFRTCFLAENETGRRKYAS